jgi:hypothetical protein
MKQTASGAVALLLMASSCTVSIYTPESGAFDARSAAEQLPPVYVSALSSSSNDYVALVKEYGTFEDVSDQAGTYPIGLRISESMRDGTNEIIRFALGLTCISSLAVIPCYGIRIRETKVSLIVGDDAEVSATHDATYSQLLSWIVPPTTRSDPNAVQSAIRRDAMASTLKALLASPEAQRIFADYRAWRAFSVAGPEAERSPGR